MRFGLACLAAAVFAAVAFYHPASSLNVALAARVAFWCLLVLGIVSIVGELIAWAFDDVEAALEQRGPWNAPQVEAEKVAAWPPRRVSPPPLHLVVENANPAPLWNGPRNPDGSCAPIGHASQQARTEWRGRFGGGRYGELRGAPFDEPLESGQAGWTDLMKSDRVQYPVDPATVAPVDPAFMAGRDQLEAHYGNARVGMTVERSA